MMMVRNRRIFAVLLSAAFAFLSTGCQDGAADAASAPDPTTDPPSDCLVSSSRPQLGLMTGLPLIWPLDADFGMIARGEAESPWQAQAIERCYTLEPLDTLSLIDAVDPAGAATDPLENIRLLAVIQPRGLSPADNVALDDWVRAGGRLLMVLDPMLTGDYDIALGDPRRPNDTALIPPVVERWGLTVRYDETRQLTPDPEASIAPGSDNLSKRLLAHGIVMQRVPSAGQQGASCRISSGGVAAQCDVGEGRVTVFADAAMFEHRDLGGENGEGILALMRFAFQ